MTDHVADHLAEHPVLACWGGPDSTGAVEFGAALAVALRQPLDLATAFVYEPVAMSARATLSAETEVRFAVAEARAAQARAVAGDGPVIRDHVLPAQTIDTALNDLAGEVDASVMTVGADLDGDVARSILMHARCPVAVVRTIEGQPRTEAPRHIAVGYDDSAASRLALRAARHLAAATGGDVTVLCVGGVSGRWPTTIESGAALEVPMHYQTIHGEEVAAALLDAAPAFDLLACGTHGHGRVLSRVAGSVSNELLTVCPVPLLLVPTRVDRRSTSPLGLSTAGDA